jgi:hypothetical protein
MALWRHPYTSCSRINIRWVRSPFPIVLVPRYKLSSCDTPIKSDLLGFPRIHVFACGLRDHITRFVSRWQPNMQFLKDDLARVLVLVKLYNVSLEYWTIKGLTCVASAIGVPLHADLATFLALLCENLC